MQQFGELLLAARKDGGNTLIFIPIGNENANESPLPLLLCHQYAIIASQKGGIDMSKLSELIAQMKSVDYQEKQQFLEYLLRVAERNPKVFSSDDKTALWTPTSAIRSRRHSATR